MKAIALFVLLATSAQSSDVTHVWGRITAVTQSGLQVDRTSSPIRNPLTVAASATSPSTPPQNSREACLRTCARVGVDIIGIATRTGVQATRVIVYEGNRPVRMTAGAPVTATNGSTR